jgi:hypothetical protein
VPVTVTVGGETAQLSPRFSAAPQSKSIGPVSPPPAVIVSVELADWPGAAILRVVGFAERVKSVTVTDTGAEVAGR